MPLTSGVPLNFKYFCANKNQFYGVIHYWNENDFAD